LAKRGACCCMGKVCWPNARGGGSGGPLGSCDDECRLGLP
jgi:hypothetical protein